MRARRVLAAAATALLAGCGAGAGADRGRATLWVTRDRGAHVVLVRRVPAGVTAMQALAGAAKIETRYGGRYVQSIGGVEGSLSGRHDWFWFVNGIEGDRSAGEYRLHAGDVEWWDFRSWRGRMEQPVVVGAFPEPFLHGYGGKRRPAAVRYESKALAAAARRLARRIGAGSVAPAGTAVATGANLLLVRSGGPCLEGRLRREGSGAGSPVVFELAGDPALFRHRYEAPCAG